MTYPLGRAAGRRSPFPFFLTMIQPLALTLLLAVLLPAPALAEEPPENGKQLTIFETIDRMEESGEIEWDRALLYRCQAYKQRDKLPPELAALPYPEEFICPLETFARARRELDRCRPEVRTLLTGVFERPASIDHVQSSTWPLRVHYETTEQIPRAEEYLGHAEQSWALFIAAGFYPPPPDDGRGGSDDYDLYIMADSYIGGIVLEDEWDGSWWADLRSYTYAQPNPENKFPPVVSTIAHELNHAFQMAMNPTELTFAEATATLMEDRVFPELDFIHRIARYFLRYPEESIDWNIGGGPPYEYGMFIFPQFIIEYYDNNQATMIGEIWQGLVQEGTKGEPDFLDSIATVVDQHSGDSFNEMFHVFTTWLWFTRQYDDGQHFIDGHQYDHVAEEASYAPGAFPLNGTATATPPAEYGCNFLQLAGGGASTGGSDTCTLHFDGDPDKAWSVQLMLFPTGGGDPQYEMLEVDEEGFGNHQVDDWAGLDYAVMSVLNLGDGDHDPENFDWDHFHYRYAAVDVGVKRASIVAGPGPGPANPALVRGFHANGQLNPYGEFEAYPDQYWGTNLACGDPDGDGIDEILTGGGPGPGVPPEVKLFEANGEEFPIFAFQAYGTSGYGVNVAFADLDGDGRDEIITGPAATYGPHVRVFRYLGGGRVDSVAGLSFMAYGTRRYGVNVAGGDVTGDGRTEIITGPGPGPSYGPQVRVFDDQGQPVHNSFFAYGTLRWGVNVCCGDIDGDGIDEIVTGAGPGAVFGPHVRAFEFDGSTSFVPIPAVSYFAYGTLRYGVNVTCGDIDGDGIEEIVTGPGPSALFGAHVRGWNYDGDVLAPVPGCSFFAFSPADTLYGANVAVGKFWE